MKMLNFSKVWVIQFFIVLGILISMRDGAVINKRSPRDLEAHFSPPKYTTQLYLNTKARHAYPQAKLVFKGPTLKANQDKFLAHTFKGKVSFVKEEFLGFSVNLMNATCEKTPGVVAYVIQSYNESTSMDSIVSNLTETFKTKREQEITMLLPYFEAKFFKFNFHAPSHQVVLNSKYLPEDFNYIKSQLRNTIHGPFSIYLIDPETKKIMSSTQVDKVGVSPSINKCTTPTLKDQFPVLGHLEDSFSFVSSIVGKAIQHTHHFFST